MAELYKIDDCSVSQRTFGTVKYVYFYGEECAVSKHSAVTNPDGELVQGGSGALDILVDAQYIDTTLSAVFIMFIIGLGVGQSIKFLGKLR